MAQPTQDQIVRAARKMCELSSDACCVNSDDTWKVYGEAYLEEARVVLAAALTDVEGEGA